MTATITVPHHTPNARVPGRLIPLARSGAAIALTLLGLAGSAPGAAAEVRWKTPAALTLETVATDWRTGYAISGYDPVSYFTRGEAVPGRPAYEAQWGGVVWMFRSAGNRDAFVANPEVYAPIQGGHDAEMARRGYKAPGNPLVWLVKRGALHLFRSPETRAAYRAR